MHSLPLFMRLAGRPVILIGDDVATAPKRRLLERAGALVVGEGAEARLAIVAVEDDGEAAAVVARLRARGVLVNAVDRPGLCDFTLPAIVDRDPLLLAIGTGGASAGLAKALRQRIEALLPATLGGVAEGLAAAREAIRARWPDPAERRRAIDAALDPGGALDPFAATDPQAVATWLDRADPRPPAGLVAIGLRSPDPDELSLREARLLGQADRVCHRADIPPAILDRARADAERIACAVAEAGPGLTLDIDWAGR
jgi:uroporphyrin-III C-methyltransferase/precorrin-2 dehydrogenase/sirohydrochlorin ferrochelatase